MKWGVFSNRFAVNVVPADDEGNPLEQHSLDRFCRCAPAVERWNRPLIIHNDDLEPEPLTVVH